MRAVIRPSAPAGSVSAPPSKSMAHRELICAGLAAGESTVRGIAPSQDVLATLDCLTALGADCRYTGDTVTLRGTNLFSPPELPILPCRECGSTLRFFVPLCLLSGKEVTLTGSETLLARPLSVYETLCRERGFLFQKGGGALHVRGRLAPGEYVIPGDISSQFVSGLLFALPLLPGESRIRLLPPVESRPYIDMTLAALREFGVSADWYDGLTLRIPGGQAYAPRDTAVEGDWSNAAFFLALGLPVEGLRRDSLQGDKICEAYFSALREGPATLDLSGCPDLGPVLFAYAALHHGGEFTGTRRLRLKESDRCAAMREELEHFGVPVTLGEDTAAVGCGVRPPEGMLSGHNDHRIVMALSVLCAHTGGTVMGAEAVNKSFPDFFQRLRAVNIGLELLPEAGEPGMTVGGIANGMDQ